MPRSKKERTEEVEESDVDTSSDVESVESDDTQPGLLSTDGTSSSDESSDEASIEPPKKKKPSGKSKKTADAKEVTPAKKRDKGDARKADKHKADKHKAEGRKAESSKDRKHKKPGKPEKKRPKVSEAQTPANSESSDASEGSGTEAENMTTSLIQQYRDKIKRFVRRDNMFGFVKILTESPLATVLENLHYLFVAASNNEEMLDKLNSINKDFNIVSRKFVKAVQTLEDSRHKYHESEEVAEKIQNNTPLKQIDNISSYTPEFIIMKTIQAGDLVACNMMLKKWDVAPMFAGSKHLIAAFYGWEDFFSKTEKFTKTQDLVVHALAGGYKRTLRLVCGGSGSKWILAETLQKAGLVCPVKSDMKARFDKLLDGRL